jgi:hypothetical protein
MARSLVRCLAALAGAALFAAAGEAGACERVAPGSCGALTAEVRQAPPQQAGEALVPQPGSFELVLTWSAAENLDAWCGTQAEGLLDSGRYEVSFDGCAGMWSARPSDGWDSRTTTAASSVSVGDAHACLWRFRVRAVGTGVEGPFSEAAAWIPGRLEKPVRATVESAVSISNPKNTLTWGEPPGRADENGVVQPILGYQVWRANDRSNHLSIPIAEVAELRYEDADAKFGEGFSYQIYAFDRWGISDAAPAYTEGGRETGERMASCGCGPAPPLTGMLALALVVGARRRR